MTASARAKSPLMARRNVAASFSSSSTAQPPPETRLLPPASDSEALSSIRTEAPASWAAMAAVLPAAPVPTTMTSYVLSVWVTAMLLSVGSRVACRHVAEDHGRADRRAGPGIFRSEEQTAELQLLMLLTHAVFC